MHSDNRTKIREICPYCRQEYTTLRKTKKSWIMIFVSITLAVAGIFLISQY